MYARLCLVVLVVIALLSPSPGTAQEGVGNAQNGTTQSVSTPGGGPRLDAIVGGAAIVLGALIGDDVGLLFMIGGAVALLIGLYRYLS